MPRLTLLLPATSRFAGAALPHGAGARTWARRSRSRMRPASEAQLARHFQLLPDRWAPAALTRVVDGGIEDARLSGWLRADPAYIRPDINGARLLATGDTLGLDANDVEALLPRAAPAVRRLPASRWMRRIPGAGTCGCRARRNCRHSPRPTQALGEDVFEHIPDGAEARRWRVLSSEAQVVLHNHPHNAARAAAGKPPINSLWFWGGGVLPDHVAEHKPDAVLGRSPAAGAGACRQADAACR